MARRQCSEAASRRTARGWSPMAVSRSAAPSASAGDDHLRSTALHGLAQRVGQQGQSVLRARLDRRQHGLEAFSAR